MGELSWPGPEPPGAKTLPTGESLGSAISQISVNAATDSRAARYAQRRDTPIEVLRERNRKIARLTALLRRVYSRGPRLTVELVLELAGQAGADDLLEELATRFGGFDQSFLRNRIGHEFPQPPVHVVGGRDL